MKKLISVFLLAFLLITPAFAENYDVFSEDGYFGLKDEQGNILLDAEYKKMINVENNSWIVLKRGRYGLIDKDGNFLVPLKYRHAERILGKFVKLGNDTDYGLYTSKGDIILPPMYSSIELLYGNMFLTCQKYKYGVVDFNGEILLANDFDDIYMPTKTSMRVLYNGEWYEFQEITKDTLGIPEDKAKITVDDKNFTFTKLVTNTGVKSSYYAVTATDYVLKLVSSISPAYEQTIDDLMLSHGAETVTIFLNPVWVVKFPFVYAKKYVNNFRAPNNGPLSPIKQNIQRKLAAD